MRKNKTSLTAHHYKSASQSLVQSSSCLLHRDTIKTHAFISSGPIFFSPPVALDRQFSIIYQPQSWPVICRATDAHKSKTQYRSRGPLQWIGLTSDDGEVQKKWGQLNLPSVCHTWIPCHRLTSAKPSTLNSSAVFEYKSVVLGVELHAVNKHELSVRSVCLLYLWSVYLSWLVWSHSPGPCSSVSLKDVKLYSFEISVLNWIQLEDFVLCFLLDKYSRVQH